MLALRQLARRRPKNHPENGMREWPVGIKKTALEIDLMIKDYVSMNPGKKTLIMNKIRAWREKNGHLTTKTVSGFYSFVIDNTKL